ncbi:MAG: type II toxin-antitoxin system RelE/ParE family toxin [Spirochaetota bacterium]
MVKISKPAREDLRQIHDYIARDSRHYAHEVIIIILENIKLIESFPRKGRIVPEIQDDNIREILVYSYRIVYRIRTSVEVAAVVHAKRDFSNAVKDRFSR